MARYQAGRWTPRRISWGLQGSTRYVRLRGVSPDLTSRPVISLHGWSTLAWDAALLNLLDSSTTTGMPYDSLLATGRTIYFPFLGPCWGRTLGTMVSSTEVTTLGGTGLGGIDDMVTRAGLDGMTATTVDLIGGSMGACNAINWANDNPASVHRIYGYVPAVEFDSLYDIGGIQTSLLNAYGGANKAAFLTASAARDPYRMDLSAIDDRISVVASNPDALIRYAGVVTWTTTWSIPLATTSSNHFSLDDAGFRELDVLEWLA